VQGTLKNFDACFGSELIDRNASWYFTGSISPASNLIPHRQLQKQRYIQLTLCDFGGTHTVHRGTRWNNFLKILRRIFFIFYC
jgi:hypothetical protein